MIVEFNTIDANFLLVEERFRKHPDAEIVLPRRATLLSAGYDFCTPEKIVLQPGEQKLIWTDICFYVGEDRGYCLKIYPRSSVGIKKNCILANTVGIIDEDYWGNPDNGGNIGICLHNIGNQIVTFEAGDRIAQGIIERYYTIRNYATGKELRSGGVGSTGK